MKSYGALWTHLYWNFLAGFNFVFFCIFFINMQMADKAYLKGFRHMDDQKQKSSMKLKKQHFKHLIETIKNYQC